MCELGDGEAVCFRLFSLFLSVCWLGKLVLIHGAFVVVVIDHVMYTMYDGNKYCDCCYRTACCAAFVFILLLL